MRSPSWGRTRLEKVSLEEVDGSDLQLIRVQTSGLNRMFAECVALRIARGGERSGEAAFFETPRYRFVGAPAAQAFRRCSDARLCVYFVLTETGEVLSRGN